MQHFHQVLADLRVPTTELRHAIPETGAGFISLHDGAMAEATASAYAPRAWDAYREFSAELTPVEATG